MTDLKKPPSKNTIIFVCFMFSLVFMGILTWGISSGYVEFPQELGETSSASKAPLDGCVELGGCLENSPIDRSAIDN